MSRKNIRAVVLGFEDLEQDLLNEFERECNLTVTKWITFEPWASEINRCTRIHQLSYDIPKDPTFLAIYDSIYANIFQFIDMFTRHYKTDARLPHYYLDAFNMFSYSAYKDLAPNTEVVLFSNIPHEGADFIYYLVAKELNIPTILFHQSLFENRFFYSFSLEDFGYFSKSHSISEKQPYLIERTHQTELFYMKKAEPQKKHFAQWIVNNFGLFLRFVKSGQWRPHRLERGILREIGYRISFLSREKDYNNSIQNIMITQDQMVEYTNLPYIYFPLHLQPELTTSALGDIFADQMLALERLSSLLPNGWKILLKENPKQTSCQRGELFFQRLGTLHNVALVPTSADTFELISKSKFVATITGTAGWEAIKGGKPALVFGRPWYLTLAGVFRYAPAIDLEAISEYKIDHEALQQSFAELMSKTGCGVVDPAYSIVVKNYNRDTNIKNICHSLCKILYLETTKPA